MRCPFCYRGAEEGWAEKGGYGSLQCMLVVQKPPCLPEGRAHIDGMAVLELRD